GSVFIDTYLRPGDNERDLALRYAETSKELIPMLGPVLEYVLRLQQLALIRQAAIHASSLEAGHVPGATEVGVCFADLVGFTTMSQDEDPENTREFLTRYFDLARTIVDRYGGTIEKFIGDAVVAIFGAPIAHGDDPERAVRAALAARAAVADLNAADPQLDLQMRVAVNTGE
ncbi:MAG: adenylate/guanylate cyclase domain-containing protein, partial [Gemmatimonadaceae bacterium]